MQQRIQSALESKEEYKYFIDPSITREKSKYISQVKAQARV